MADLLQWLNLHPQLAGLVTFIISAAESIAIIGTIIPGSVTMTAIGALAGSGVIPLYQTVVWAILGAIVGDGISYWIGHYFNEQLPTIWPFRKYPTLLETGETFFLKHGGKSVFIGRFVGPVRALVPLVAGMLGMKPIRFILANILSAIAWAPAYMLPGILLGMASLELPPDIAVHAMLMLILITLLGLFCFWIIYKLLKLISHQIDDTLNKLWFHLRTSRLRFITVVLEHHNPEKKHGQLVLAFYFLLTCLALGWLTYYVLHDPSNSIFINNLFYHLARSVRTSWGDSLNVLLTFLGDKKIILPLSLIFVSWLFFQKYIRTALHFALLIIINVSAVEILKKIVHSVRPWGVVNNAFGHSFPSGHASLATVFYISVALILIQLYKIKKQRWLYIFSLSIILLVSASRIYLGAHWFTDVLGGWLLGASVLMIVIISYNRHQEKQTPPKGLAFVLIGSFLVIYSLFAFFNFSLVKKNQSLLPWPAFVETETNWWQQTGNHLPLYRYNRFGLPRQLLNVQWLGNIEEIKKTLLQHGWELPPDRDWINILHRIGDVDSTAHLPLVSPLYLDEKPTLVLIKYRSNKQLIALRLWESNLKINPQFILWVGSVELVPRTYSWLFKRNKTLVLTPSLLFTHSIENYKMKIFVIKPILKNKRVEKLPILLLKPKNI